MVPSSRNPCVVCIFAPLRWFNCALQGQTGVESRTLPRAGSLLEPSHVVGRALLVAGRGGDVQNRLDRVAVPPALDFRMAIGERKATGAVMIRSRNIRPVGAGHKH